MNTRAAVLSALLASACAGEPEPGPGDAATAPTRPTDPVDAALLHELLGESVRVQVIGEGAGARDDIHADGMLVRLAFDPLIRATGPVQLQQVQGQGYRLTGIADGSPLWLLGLREGDVLTAVDDHAILGREHELRSTYESRPNRAVLTFLRGTETHSIHLSIGSGSVWRSTGDPPQSPAILHDSRIPPSRNPLAVLEFAAGLRCSEGARAGVIGRCEIEREALDGLLEDPASLARQARIVPSQRDGETVGFKIYGVRPSSVPYLIGLENGDLITSVNGESLRGVDTALASYETLSGATELSVTIERKGVASTLEFVIVDALSGPAVPLRGASPESKGESRVSPDLRDPFGGR